METLQDQARMLHELYTSLVNEGFSAHQAQHIVMGQPCCQFTYREEE